MLDSCSIYGNCHALMHFLVVVRMGENLDRMKEIAYTKAS
jgi:hypothetical protein